MKSLLLLSAVLGIASAAYELNLKQSIDRIQEQINVTRENPPQWNKLDKIIDDALDCISGLDLGLSIFTVVDEKWMSPSLIHYIESISYASLGRQLQNVDWEAVQAKGSSVNPQDALEDLKEFMQTEKYVAIHNHIWKHEEFLDLIRFLFRAKYDKIYEKIAEFYQFMGRSDLDIPNGPDWTPSTMYAARQLPQGGGDQFPVLKFSPPTISAKCTIEGGDLGGLQPLWDVINDLNASNIHQVIKVLLYMLQEVIGNVAMHVLLLKLGEPHKGEFFHSTLELPEMKEEGITHVKNLVLSEPGIAQLNEVLKQVTGLDLGNQDLFNYITNLVMYLVWNYPFPAKE